MKMFRDLTPEEEQEFRKWARDNYKPLTPISGVWHPVIQAECSLMNQQAELTALGLWGNGKETKNES